MCVFVYVWVCVSVGGIIYPWKHCRTNEDEDEDEAVAVAVAVAVAKVIVIVMVVLVMVLFYVIFQLYIGSDMR